MAILLKREGVEEPEEKSTASRKDQVMVRGRVRVAARRRRQLSYREQPALEHGFAFVGRWLDIPAKWSGKADCTGR
jgi:hypothetical protein